MSWRSILIGHASCEMSDQVTGAYDMTKKITTYTMRMCKACGFLTKHSKTVTDRKIVKYTCLTCREKVEEALVGSNRKV